MLPAENHIHASFRTAFKKAVLIVTWLFAGICSSAQSYTGYHSSSYCGVYGIVTNPVDILNHRFRGDFNLAGFSTAVGNNIVGFTYSKVNDDDGGISFPNPVREKGKVNFNTDVFGPSVLIKLSDKNAIAFTTRARTMVNVHGVSTDFLNTVLPETIDPAFINTKLAVGDISVNVHAWKEIALTYSRQFKNSAFGVWKMGVSAKYLGGAGAFSMHTYNLAFTYDSLIGGGGRPEEAVFGINGIIAFGYTKNMDSLTADNLLSFKNSGVGADIGVSYEYRDEMQVYETAYSEKTANYKWKIGAAITDIGFIRYRKDEVKWSSTALAGNGYFIDQLDPPSDSSELYQLYNYYNNLFGSRTEPNILTMQLPTTLRLTYDRYFNKWLAVQGQVNIPLLFSPINYYNGNFHPVSVSVTPRAEVPLGGVYFPLSYNSISGFQAGASLRLGPLVIGSASIINSRLMKTKGIDAYFILRVPFFGYRRYVEKGEKDKSNKLTRRQKKMLNCPGL